MQLVNDCIDAFLIDLFNDFSELSMKQQLHNELIFGVLMLLVCFCIDDFEQLVLIAIVLSIVC